MPRWPKRKMTEEQRTRAASGYEMAKRMARAYCRRFQDLDGIESHAMLTLVRAAMLWNEYGGKDFVGYAYHCIRVEMRRYVYANWKSQLSIVPLMDDIEDEKKDDGQDVPSLDKMIHLAEEYSDTLKLVYVDGLTYQQAGEKLGITKQGVEYRCRKGRKKILETFWWNKLQGNP